LNAVKEMWLEIGKTWCAIENRLMDFIAVKEERRKWLIQQEG